MDEILGYLLDDPGALKACSLTCKCLFGATRPLIHRRLVCLDPRLDLPKQKGPLFRRLKRDPGTFKRLVDADHLGVLRYTRYLTLKPENNSTFEPRFGPKDLQEHLPRFRSITKLDGLTLDAFHLPLFAPVFDEYFGMFANTLRYLCIRRAHGGERAILYIVSKFPLLEDLTIISPADQHITHPVHPVPTITQSPPLRGKLVLVNTRSRVLPEGLAAFPGGLYFRSLELSWCKHPQAVLTACGRTAVSISYLWRTEYDNSESSPIQVHIAM